MEKNELILAEEFCVYHEIEISFIHSLTEYGLIEVIVTDNKTYLPYAQLDAIERYKRLHYDLHINLEGLDSISHLLERIRRMNVEMAELRNRLHSIER